MRGDAELEPVTVRSGAWVVTSPPPVAPPPAAPPAAPRRPRRRAVPSFAFAFAASIVIGLLGGAALARPSLFLPWAAATPAVTVPSAVTVQPPVTVAPAATAVTSADPVRVADQGFTNLAGSLTFAVVLRNGGRELTAADIRVLVIFSGEGGDVLGVRQARLGALAPGQTGAVAGEAALRGVTGMRARVRTGRWARPGGDLLTVRRVQTTRYGDALTTSAQIGADAATEADVTAVYYDRGDRIVGGATTRTLLPSRGIVPVAIERLRAPASVARAEVLATP